MVRQSSTIIFITNSFYFRRINYINNLKISTKKMATFMVRQGLNQKRRLPETQMLILGRKNTLKNVELTSELSAKLQSVETAHFGEAMSRIFTPAGNGQIPLYLNLATIATIPDEVSRHNAPSNSLAIFKEVKILKLAKGVKDLSIILYVDYPEVMASVAAVARAFPLFSAKTKKESALENVELELMIKEKKLSDNEMEFLQSLCDNIRNCARLVDTPTCVLHSQKFLEEALSMVNGLGVPIDTTVIKGKELLENGFGGIYSVGQAAKNPPVFACFSHVPKGATESIALVGKGIVYDTGGLSLKGKLAMPTMKIDMGGAAAVLSAFCTLVKSGTFQQGLHCLLCIAENQISPEATRPDDILKMLSGKTVEVNNTDAEGRLVLADGVYYARQTLKATTIIDMATLTGAQLTATGKYHAAILTNSEMLEMECIRAGKKSGDLVHPLPYTPELHFAQNLSSEVADMKNACFEGATGPPSAIAGLFIGSHIEFGRGGSDEGKRSTSAESVNESCKSCAEKGGGNNVDWLHIDMAGLATSGKGGRATGWGVALLCSLLSKHTKDIGIAN